MPVKTLMNHIEFALGYILNEPQFKAHFVENNTEDGSEEAIAESLNDDEIVHIWKSAYIAEMALKGNLELLGDHSDDV